MAQEVLSPLAYPSSMTQAPQAVKPRSLLARWSFFGLLHLACLAVIWVGWSGVAVGVAVALYIIRMFAVTAFYHRYFSHRSYKTSRLGQFLFAVLGCSAAQQGPLWWAAHHRHHHQYSDQPEDVHSPRQKGFWFSHMGWVTEPANYPVRAAYIPDLMKYPELIWLEKYHLLITFALGAATFLLGTALEAWIPSLGTNGVQMLIWGYFISTVCLYHGTFTINSLSHQFGSQRYQTGDDSRNNWFFALITLGEGWHNNHHYYATSVRQGFYWWEIDISYYGLWLMSKLGIIWDLKAVPAHLKEKHQ